MGIAAHIFSNVPISFEIPDPMEDPFVDNNQQLSHEEFKTLLDALVVMNMKFTRHDNQSLSDYAVSREGIYEGHPKL